MKRPTHVPVIFYTNPFELVLGAALAINGVVGLAGRPSPSLADLPIWPLRTYLIVSTIGGIGLIWGLSRRDETDTMGGPGRAIERAALFLVAAGYMGLGTVVLINNSPRGIATAVVSILIGIACLLRARSIRRTTLVILEQLRVRQ